jgi:hypothetical protein
MPPRRLRKRGRYGDHLAPKILPNSPTDYCGWPTYGRPPLPAMLGEEVGRRLGSTCVAGPSPRQDRVANGSAPGLDGPISATTSRG